MKSSDRDCGFFIFVRSLLWRGEVMESLKLFWLIMKRTHGDRLFYGFIIFYVLDCIGLWLFDPGLANPGDAFWLGFNIATSIGLGDFTVTAPLARICAVLLGIYGVVIVAFIPGLIASYYSEKTRLNTDQSIEQHYDELLNLDHMSSEQKKNLSSAIKNERHSL